MHGPHGWQACLAHLLHPHMQRSKDMGVNQNQVYIQSIQYKYNIFWHGIVRAYVVVQQGVV